MSEIKSEFYKAIEKVENKKIDALPIFLSSLLVFLVFSDYRLGMFLYIKSVVFALFILSTFNASKKFIPLEIIKINRTKYFIISFFVISFFIVNFEEFGLVKGIRNVLSNILLLSPVYMLDYFKLKKKNNNIKILFAVNIMIILFICIKGIIFGIKEPYIMRVLARGDMSDFPQYASLGIGGYGFAYAMVFICFSLIVLYKNFSNLCLRPSYKLFILLIITVLLYAQILHEYTIGIVLVFLFGSIIFILSNQTKKKLKISIFIFFLITPIFIVLLFNKQLIGMFFEKLANLFTNYKSISSRFKELSELLSFNYVNGDTQLRFERYSVSYNLFINNFLAGVQSFRVNSYIIYGHSTLIDSLAYYGMAFSFPIFLNYWYLFKDMTDRYKKNKLSVWIVGIAYLVFSAINTSLSPAIIMSIFYTFPLTLEIISMYDLVLIDILIKHKIINNSGR